MRTLQMGEAIDTQVDAMNFNRRDFIKTTSGIIGAGCLGHSFLISPNCDGLTHASSFKPPSFAVIPVVGDGKWIWKDPPADGQSGYLEPRE